MQFYTAKLSLSVKIFSNMQVLEIYLTCLYPRKPLENIVQQNEEINQEKRSPRIVGLTEEHIEGNPKACA